MCSPRCCKFLVLIGKLFIYTHICIIYILFADDITSYPFISVGDSYPKRYGCTVKYPCALLKQKGKCNFKWKQAGLPQWCLKTLNAWEKNQRVRTNHCRRTCRTCRSRRQTDDLRNGDLDNYFGKKRILEQLSSK